MTRIRFSMELTLPRVLVGLVLYVAGLALVWPPTWGSAVMLGVSSAVLMGVVTGLEVQP